MSQARELLPAGARLPFAEAGKALVHQGEETARSNPARALTATVVAVGPVERLADAADVLQCLGMRAVRGILISEGTSSRPDVRVSGNTIALSGLKAPFIDNAVAALRLSSLPTLVWWRGSSYAVLDELVRLADRVVLDDPEPLPVWKRAVDLFEQTAFSDMRWARLTRWRTLMAHFFDIPEVRAASSRFRTLDIAGDAMAAGLFGAWLAESLGRAGAAIRVNHSASSRGMFLESMRLTNGEEALTLTVNTAGTCVLSGSEVQGHKGATRMVAIGDQSDSALLAEELQIRARDLAFERALRAVVRPPGVNP